MPMHREPRWVRQLKAGPFGVALDLVWRICDVGDRPVPTHDDATRKAEFSTGGSAYLIVALVDHLVVLLLLTPTLFVPRCSRRRPNQARNPRGHENRLCA